MVRESQFPKPEDYFFKPLNETRQRSCMAFIRYMTDQELPSADRVPDSDNILQIHGVHPQMMHQHYQLYLEIMHREGPVTRRQRELLAVRVSALNGCH